MKIDPKNLTDIILEETNKVLEAKKRGFLRHAYKKFMQNYEKAKTGAETQPSPQEQPTKKSADSAWGTQGYQDVEWSPSEPQALAPSPDKPNLGPSVEKTAAAVGITDEALLQKLVAKLKGIEVVSDDRPTLTGQQVKDILLNLGAEDATDPETSGISDEFVEKVIDQGRLYERVMRILTEQDTSLEQLIQSAKSRSGRCNKQGFVGFGAEKLSDKHLKFISQIQEKLRNEGVLSEGDSEGVFGPKTLEAVIKAQQSAGIKVDGCVGPNTVKAFNMMDEYNEMTVISRGSSEIGSYKIEKTTGQVAQGRVGGKRAVFLPDETRVGGTLAWRNNNPGNLRLRRYWKNWGALGRAFGFATFPTAEDGFSALKKYIDKYGFQKKKHTIASFMSDYAPKQDANNPASYAAKIASSLNVSVDDNMSNFAGDEEALELFAKAIRKVEGWRRGKVSRDLALAKIAPDVVTTAIAEGKNNE